MEPWQALLGTLGLLGFVALIVLGIVTDWRWVGWTLVTLGSAVAGVIVALVLVDLWSSVSW